MGFFSKLQHNLKGLYNGTFIDEISGFEASLRISESGSLFNFAMSCMNSLEAP